MKWHFATWGIEVGVNSAKFLENYFGGIFIYIVRLPVPIPGGWGTPGDLDSEPTFFGPEPGPKIQKKLEKK